MLQSSIPIRFNVLVDKWGTRRLLQVTWDWAVWLLAVPLALLLRYDFSISAPLAMWALGLGFFAGLFQILLGSAFHLHQGRYVVGSFDEVLGVIVTTVTLGGIATLLLFVLQSSQFPRSTFIIGTGIAALGMLGARFLYRKKKQLQALCRLYLFYIKFPTLLFHYCTCPLI